MNQGVIYFNLGTKCILRLLVSLQSLRKHYAGAVAVLNAGEIEPWFEAEIIRLKALPISIPNTGEKALVQKAGVWRYTPFEHTLFLDADTIVCQPINAAFDAIAKHGFVVNHFSEWRTDGRKIASRIRAWKPAIGAAGVAKALAYGPAVNTGIHGYHFKHPMLPRWYELTRRGCQLNCTVRLVDELACQCLLPDHPQAGTLGNEWGASVRFGNPGAAVILHFHGQKHAGDWKACEYWKREYRELIATSPEAGRFGQGSELSDRRLDRWLAKTCNAQITIVTAVNPPYMHKLAANWPKWMADPELAKQKFIVFWNREKPKFLEGLPHVRLINWKFDIAGDNLRERMLSAFVFGAAEHVKTPYWMKLDCDATPTGKQWAWPEYQNADIIGHRCGYTKTKGQPGATRHFLNQLDAWWQAKTGEPPIFPADIPADTRYGHRRAASFCWIEKTANTRFIAELCGKRLPVPSHDTIACYVAERKNWKMQRQNMKRYFSP
jgi:hypothetical protein